MNNEVSIPWHAVVERDLAVRSKAEKARRHVARHARLDADARAFVIPPRALEGMEPASCGFSPSPVGMRWSADGLFTTCPPGKPSWPTYPEMTRPRFRDSFEDSETSAAADRGDPFRCLPQLSQTASDCQRVLGALARGSVDAQSRSRLALHVRDLAANLALDLGRCRLFGVSPEVDFTLAPRAFEFASTVLIESLMRVLRRTDRVGASPDAALRLLEIRTDAHATYLALDEAYAAARYEGDVEAPAMGRRLHQVRRIINLLDNNLRNLQPLLSPAASTQLTENWRRLLAPEYREIAPWWMAGELD
jgi:hypothetical protein